MIWWYMYVDFQITLEFPNVPHAILWLTTEEEVWASDMLSKFVQIKADVPYKGGSVEPVLTTNIQNTPETYPTTFSSFTMFFFKYC